jgi:large subunit ribosomal protein L13
MLRGWLINAERVVLSGNKMEDKEYISFSGFMGGKKVATAKEILAKHPTWPIEKAVKGMLPKNKLNKEVIKKLRVYVGSEHPHKAQVANPTSHKAL